MNIDKTTPKGKGIRTGIQALVGALVALGAAVWAVPGVPEAVQQFISENWVALVLAFGIPSGAVAWAQNRLGW